MKKIVLALLTIVLMLSAVEWDKEVIIAEQYVEHPLLAVDSEGYVSIVYLHWINPDGFIKVASNKTGSWVFKDVPMNNTEYYDGYYSICTDNESNTFVAFMDFGEGDNYDLFLSADTGGEFTTINLTSDMNNQFGSVIHVDDQGIIQILYDEILPTEEINLMYGWIDSEDFHNEEVTQNRNDDFYHNIDLVLSSDGAPHAFYVGADNYIHHATRSALSAFPAWSEEQVNEIPSQEITAAIDASGKFHISYDEDYEILHYVTNLNGPWEGDTVDDGATADNEEPSIVVDLQGNPHIAWLRYDFWCDIYFASKTPQGWLVEPVTSTPDGDDWPGTGHFFVIDDDGYGHLTYSYYDEYLDTTYLYYAKSTEPLTGSGIAEQPAASNPFNLEVHGSSVHFSLPEQSSISVNLYDACGRRVERLASGTFTAGEHTVPINSTGLAAGVYFIRAEIAERSANAKFVLTR